MAENDRGTINLATLDSIGAAIQEKLNTQTAMTPAAMPEAIRSIETGITPAGTINITANGTVDVTQYASANVQVPDGGGEDPFALTDYIESSGTQWIDTGYTVQENSRLELIANISNIGTVPCPFGVRASGSGTAAAQGIWMFSRFGGGNTIYYSWGSKETGVESNSAYVAQKSLYSMEKGAISIESQAGEAKRHLFDAGAVTSQYALFIFSLNQAGAEYGSDTRCRMKMYRFRIFEAETLVHDFRPWTDDNNVVCLKDLVTGDLKYNAGTGYFTRGTDT